MQVLFSNWFIVYIFELLIYEFTSHSVFWIIWIIIVNASYRQSTQKTINLYVKCTQISSYYILVLSVSFD